MHCGAERFNSYGVITKHTDYQAREKLKLCTAGTVFHPVQLIYNVK